MIDTTKLRSGLGSTKFSSTRVLHPRRIGLNGTVGFQQLCNFSEQQIIAKTLVLSRVRWHRIRVSFKMADRIPAQTKQDNNNMMLGSSFSWNTMGFGSPWSLLMCFFSVFGAMILVQPDYADESEKLENPSNQATIMVEAIVHWGINFRTSGQRWWTISTRGHPTSSAGANCCWMSWWSKRMCYCRIPPQESSQSKPMSQWRCYFTRGWLLLGCPMIYQMVEVSSLESPFACRISSFASKIRCVCFGWVKKCRSVLQGLTNISRVVRCIHYILYVYLSIYLSIYLSTIIYILKLNSHNLLANF